MGVRSVRKLLCSLEKGVSEIDMRRKIETWRIEEEGKKPTLAIDAMGLLQLTTRQKEDVYCGGRHNTYYTLIESLFQKWFECGAELKFFFDSSVSPDKYDGWCSRRDNAYNDTCKAYDCISKGEYPHPKDGPRALTTIVDALHTIAKTKGVCYYSVDNDRELAKFASDSDNNVKAVVTSDTDFLIFEGTWEYWSSEDINLENFTTNLWRRDVILRKLKLSYKQMPLFATLMENDYTHSISDELHSFHDNLRRRGNKWLEVALYVKKVCESAFDLSDGQINAIAKQICTESCPEKVSEMISNGIQSYNLTLITDHRSPGNHSHNEAKLAATVQTLSTNMYDWRKVDTETSYTVIMAEFVRKCVGIYWKHENVDHKFTLMAKWSHDEQYTKKTMNPIFPPDELEIPPYKMLSSYDFQSRLKLFEWLLSSKGRDYKTDMRLEPGVNKFQKFQLATTALQYMLEENQIHEDEAVMILIAEIYRDRDEVAQYSFPLKPKERLVHVAHLFGMIYYQIRFAFKVAGLADFVEGAFRFDAVAYHQLSTAAQENPQLLQKYEAELKKHNIKIK